MTSGKVGIVHEPHGVSTENVASIVQSRTQTLFRVGWKKQGTTSCESLSACGWDSCEANVFCSSAEDGRCLCDVDVTNEAAFDAGSPPTRQLVLDSLRIGAIKPVGQTAQELPNSGGVKVYGPIESFTQDTVFEVQDDFGKSILRKNQHSTVKVYGTDLGFRNPVHFIALADPEPRDLHYETEATLDHYFYHKNTAPFLAYRFAQRFGISNPSPRYTQVVAKAFTSGRYQDSNSGLKFGTGGYGDLSSTFAALLLDREARDFLLDADPMYGSLKEPIMKLVGLFRSLNFNLNSLYKWVELRFDMNDILGQMPHQIPSVFSFFLPEYKPSGTSLSAEMSRR